MNYTKKIISLIMALLLASSFILPAFAAEDEFVADVLMATPDENTTPDVDEMPDSDLADTPDIAEDLIGEDDSAAAESEGSSKVLTTDRAIKVALTAAKSHFATKGISTEITKTSDVTKVKYDKKSGSYHIIIRAKRIYKYECDVVVKSFLGSELGLPENSVFTQQGKIGAFFSQGAEKFSYFFIRLFHNDGPKA